MKNSRHISPYLMLPVLLLAMALGAAGLNTDIVWMDEMFSLGNMGAFDDFFSPVEVLASLSEESPDHVPLYFVLGSQWARLTGWSQVALRYLSLLFGLLLIASVYRLTADLDNRLAGLVAAFLVTTCAMINLYSHEIRMYTMLSWLAIAHTWMYWRLQVDGRGGRPTKFFFVVSAILLLYIHIFSVFFFVGLGLQHLICAKMTRRWFGIIAGWAIAVLAFLPYLPIFAVGFRGVTRSATIAAKALPTGEVAELLAHLLVNEVIILWLPIVALAARLLARRRRGNFLRILVMTLLMIGAIFSFNSLFQSLNITRFRYFVIAMPFFCVAVAMLLAAESRLRALLIASLGLWVFGAVQIWQQGAEWRFAGRQTLLMKHQPMHRLTDALFYEVRPHDHVVGIARSPMINWRYKHGVTTSEYYMDVILGVSGGFVNKRLEGAELRVEISKRLDDYPYLLYSYDPTYMPIALDDLHQAIQADFKACEVLFDLPELFVQRYVDRAIECDREYEPIHYENGIKIVDKFGEYDSEREIVRVVTGWEVADEALLYKYNVSIQIITPDWRQVSQYGDRDSHLHNNVLKWYDVEMTTAGLPPGDYRVVVIVYDRNESSDKVAGVDLTTGEAGAILPIFTFTIE